MKLTPTPQWIHETVARVTAKYAPLPRCTKDAWPTVRCELQEGHEPPCVAPSHFEDASTYDGPVPSSTFNRTGKTYHVHVDPRSSSCTCEGFTKYNRGRDCSHIRTVKEALSLR